MPFPLSNLGRGTVVTLLALTCAGFSSQPEPRKPIATAQLEPRSGSSLKGSVTFHQKGQNLEVSVQLMSLESGYHGIHIHENGDCSAPDAASAGGHLSPLGHPHGSPTSAKRHVGDMGNVLASVNGVATAHFSLTPPAGLESWRAILGKAVIVHAGKDDFSSQPAGDAGKRIACGVIQSTSDAAE